jgi:hypothetical protein
MYASPPRGLDFTHVMRGVYGMPSRLMSSVYTREVFP